MTHRVVFDLHEILRELGTELIPLLGIPEIVTISLSSSMCRQTCNLHLAMLMPNSNVDKHLSFLQAPCIPTNNHYTCPHVIANCSYNLEIMYTHSAPFLKYMIANDAHFLATITKEEVQMRHEIASWFGYFGGIPSIRGEPALGAFARIATDIIECAVELTAEQMPLHYMEHYTTFLRHDHVAQPFQLSITLTNSACGNLDISIGRVGFVDNEFDNYPYLRVGNEYWSGPEATCDAPENMSGVIIPRRMLRHAMRAMSLSVSSFGGVTAETMAAHMMSDQYHGDMLMFVPVPGSRVDSATLQTICDVLLDNNYEMLRACVWCQDDVANVYAGHELPHCEDEECRESSGVFYDRLRARIAGVDYVPSPFPARASSSSSTYPHDEHDEDDEHEEDDEKERNETEFNYGFLKARELDEADFECDNW